MEQNSAKYHSLTEKDTLYIETEKTEFEMKQKAKFLFLLGIVNCQWSMVNSQEHVVPFSFGDMDHWVVREIHESGIIGGNTKNVYEIAPIIGFLYGRQAELDKSGDATKIFPDKLLKEQQNLLFNYRLIMILDKNHAPDLNERLNKAFRYYGTDKAEIDENLYDRYVRGGVEVLYEKLIQSATNEEDYLKNLYDFLDEFNDRYNDTVSTEDIVDLCQLARN